MSDSEPEPESPESESTSEPADGEPPPESTADGEETTGIGATLGLFSGDRGGSRSDTGFAGGPVPGADGGVVAALVTEIREGAASDDARIEHLQARVGEFEAYAEDLRAVIDEHGSAGTFADRFERRLDGLRDGFSDVFVETAEDSN